MAGGVAVLLIVFVVSKIDFYGVDRTDEVEARYRVASAFEKI